MVEKVQVVRSPEIKDEELSEIHYHNDIEQPAVDLNEATGVLAHSSLTGVTSDQHHARAHSINSATDHSGTPLTIGNGGTGETSAIAAFDGLAPTTTKGDLIVNNGTDNVRQAVGTNDYVLMADSTAGTGVKWGEPVRLAKITTFNSIATEGYGVPAIVDNVALTGQVADITTTNFTNCGVAGVYQINYVILCTTADGTAGTLTLTIAWTDGAGATTHTNTRALTATGRASSVLYVQLASGNITYAVANGGIYGSAVYALYMSAERLN